MSVQPSEKVCLSQWYFTIESHPIFNYAGKSFYIYVEGEPDPTNDFVYSKSSRIEKRVDNNPLLLQASDGKTYSLQMPMSKIFNALHGYPSSLTDKFRSGFPDNWLTLIEDYFTERCETGFESEWEKLAKLYRNILRDARPESILQMPSTKEACLKVARKAYLENLEAGCRPAIVVPPVNNDDHIKGNNVRVQIDHISTSTPIILPSSRSTKNPQFHIDHNPQMEELHCSTISPEIVQTDPSNSPPSKKRNPSPSPILSPTTTAEIVPRQKSPRKSKRQKKSPLKSLNKRKSMKNKNLKSSPAKTNTASAKELIVNRPKTWTDDEFLLFREKIVELQPVTLDDFTNMAKLFRNKTKFQCRWLFNRCRQDLLAQTDSPKKKPKQKASSPKKPSPKKKRTLVAARKKPQETIRARLQQKDRLKHILQHETNAANGGAAGQNFDEFFQSHAAKNALQLIKATSAVPNLDGFEDSLSFATTPCSLAGKSRVFGSLSAANSMMSEQGTTNNVTTTELNGPAATKNAENIMYQLRKDPKKKPASMRRSCLKRPRMAALTGQEQRRQVDTAIELLRQKNQLGQQKRPRHRVVCSSESEDGERQEEEESNLSSEHF